jgi:uncharacterized PurR-regulated membrane protein YhhQ (DUF165 family)
LEAVSLIAAVLYILAVLVANYTATNFFELPVFGLVSWAVFVFGVTFTLRDYVHRHGRKWVYLMIGIAAVLQAIECLLLGVEWRIMVASFTAIILAETTDTEFYHRLDLPWIKRVAASNAVSIPLDSLLFNGIAFLGVFEPEVLVAIIFGEIVFKTIMGIVAGVPRWMFQRSSIVPVAIASSHR